MNSTERSRIEADHKSWLNDIERWDYDLRIWNRHRDELLADAQKFVEVVEKFAADVETHQRLVDQHRKAIVDCERMMFKHDRTDEEQQAISSTHDSAETVHHEQFGEHWRLEQLRHNLMTRLSMLHLPNTGK